MTIVTKTELQDIQEAMINLINTFPELPSEVQRDGILFEQMKAKSVCMGLSTVRNPYKIKNYINGSYISRYQFRLLFQTMSTTNEERIENQSVLSKIGEWIEGRTILSSDGTAYTMGEYPTLEDGRKIIKLYKNTLPKIIQRLPANIEIIEAIYTAEYFVKI